MLNLSKQQVTTLLTLFFCAAWIVTAVVRIWVEFPAAYVLDAAMPLIIGTYFVSKNGYKHETEVPA